jgi:hypothetical protein
VCGLCGPEESRDAKISWGTYGLPPYLTTLPEQGGVARRHAGGALVRFDGSAPLATAGADLAHQILGPSG